MQYILRLPKNRITLPPTPPLRLMPSPPPAPLPPSPSAREAGELQSIPSLCFSLNRTPTISKLHRTPTISESQPHLPFSESQPHLPFSEAKVALAPPPLLEGGEGARGRDGTHGFKPHHLFSFRVEGSFSSPTSL